MAVWRWFRAAENMMVEREGLQYLQGGQVGYDDMADSLQDMIEMNPYDPLRSTLEGYLNFELSDDLLKPQIYEDLPMLSHIMGDDYDECDGIITMTIEPESYAETFAENFMKICGGNMQQCVR